MSLRLTITLATVAFVGVASAEKAELVWQMKDGRRVTESRALVEQDGILRLTVTQAELAARGKDAKSLVVTPAFGHARTGEKGWWVSPYGYYGEWDVTNGVYRAADERMNMPMYGWATPRGTYLAVITSLACYPELLVTASKGEYDVSCALDERLLRRPYADFTITYRRYPAGTGYPTLAAAYRDYQLKRGAVKTLAERVKANPILKQAVESPEIRIRQAWKPVPSPVPHQCPENEPEVKAVVTFDRVKDIVRELKAQGVRSVELCLVGWNIGGHDGRWPQMFPAEAKLGGDAKLREAIAFTRENGYLIVPHGNFRDTYTIADSWDAEFLVKGPDGEVRADRGGKFTWGGGMPYVICPKRAYEKYCLKDMPRLAALGFRGMGYFDVVSILLASECWDPRHPVTFADGAAYWGRAAEISRREFGGFASEGSVDHFAGSLDSVLYASFTSPEKLAERHRRGGLAKTTVPMFQLVYNGIIVQNPFTETVNFTAQPRLAQLRFLEYGGRPNFYFYSKFVSNGTDWMGKNDLGCGTDEQLKWSVARVKEGADLYARFVRLQYEQMTDHARPAPGVSRTTWSDGTRLYVNYNPTPVTVEGVAVPAEDWTEVRP